MASLIIHLCIAKELEKIIPPKNVNNFRIGHILPDAVIKADKKQAGTHFEKIFETDGKRFKLFDYYGFYDKFKEYLPGDELFLGYYFHLIQDNLFRTLLYRDLGMLKRRGDKTFLKELYSDYGILNGLLTEKYSLKDDLKIPTDFTQSKINKIYNFELTEFLEDMSGDFQSESTAAPKILTEEITEKFITECTEICQSEYEAIKQNKHSLSETQLAFEI